MVHIEALEFNHLRYIRNDKLMSSSRNLNLPPWPLSLIRDRLGLTDYTDLCLLLAGYISMHYSRPRPQASL